jgi:hypothetical protein
MKNQFTIKTWQAHHEGLAEEIGPLANFKLTWFAYNVDHLSWLFLSVLIGLNHSIKSKKFILLLIHTNLEGSLIALMLWR